MSYMEIYNEEINDLLVPEHRKLQIHESLEVVLNFKLGATYCSMSKLLFTFVDVNYFLQICSGESMLLVCEKRLLLLLTKFSILWNLENVI